mmetsp:Transcript_18269/g.32503  ORF Transcript_18269/g.32503 Transcript_18269/m.32503 type:complete len:153 (-) Transcript_18269:43-501(-)
MTDKAEGPSEADNGGRRAILADGECERGEYPPQRTYNLACPSTYALLKISYVDGERAVSPETVSALARQGLTETLGCVGGALPFDVLLTHPSGLATIRVDKGDATRCLAALASVTEHRGYRCQVTTLAIVRSLGALSPIMTAALRDSELQRP